MNRDAETPRLDPGALRENADCAAPKVAHRTHNPQQGRTQPPARMLGAIQRLILRTYWKSAKRHYQRGDYFDYGSPDWCALPLEDPRKMAGLVAFAQMWARYGDEIAEDLNRQLATPEPLWQRATTEACNTAVRQIRAKQERIKKEAA
ncbi:hypothetical protein [Streptomyces griseoflavus]|uniref:hypothetical protein n=1 Tax=Streptomyces griseoflavus TaxID=35619 RepID=UPI0033F941EA